ncbi:hypothetical protein [Streptomyces rubiginosohelvolus]|uniref:hypothetical protein n=1 Tax=Streptomyces rubiginosohelvolus TaxID=67362 RepID=UPI0036832E68
MAATPEFAIGKDFHRLAALDASGRPLLSHPVGNDPESIDQAVGELRTVQAGRTGLTIGLDLVSGIAGLRTHHSG